MTKEEIGRKISALALELTGAEPSEKEPLAECGLDSLSLVSLLAGREEEFGFWFDDDDLQPDRLATLRDLTELTEKYI